MNWFCSGTRWRWSTKIVVGCLQRDLSCGCCAGSFWRAIRTLSPTQRRVSFGQSLPRHAVKRTNGCYKSPPIFPGHQVNWPGYWIARLRSRICSGSHLGQHTSGAMMAGFHKANNLRCAAGFNFYSLGNQGATHRVRFVKLESLLTADSSMMLASILSCL